MNRRMPMDHIDHLGASIHFKTAGKGNTAVLLHGFLEDLSMWEELVPHLLKNHQVLRIDLLGHGKTDNLSQVHSMEDQAGAVLAVLDALGIDQCDLVGHSMGGYVALALAEKIPERVRSICLMNSTSFPDTEEKKINRDRAITAVNANHKSFVRIAIPGLFAPWNREEFAEEIAEVTEQALHMSAQGITASLEGMKIRKDRSDLFRTGPFRKSLIIGEQDPALDLETLKTQASYPGVRSAVFGDGHMSHIENREQLLSALQRFLED